jgi:hypothetical protein
LGLGEQFAPIGLFDLTLMPTAGGQDDLDAGRFAGRAGDGADGDVVEIGGVDAPLESGRQLFGGIFAAVAGPEDLGLIDLIDEDGPAGCRPG